MKYLRYIPRILIVGGLIMMIVSHIAISCIDYKLTHHAEKSFKPGDVWILPDSSGKAIVTRTVISATNDSVLCLNTYEGWSATNTESALLMTHYEKRIK